MCGKAGLAAYLKSKHMIISWFSAGITSAVACKLAVENFNDVRLFYIETGSHHADNLRFLADCEKWIGQKIEIVRSQKYTDVSDVILSRRFINSPGGASCTDVLKKQVRRDLHRKLKPSAHVMGFEYEKSEIERANNFRQRHPEANFIFPLIDFMLSKNECAGIVSLAGIKLPEMYLLGYEHNNCVGCVKGGMGYWNKIRRDFPDVFQARAAEEREVGATCINGIYLDELDPNAGLDQKEIMPDCGIFCQYEHADLLYHRG